MVLFDQKTLISLFPISADISQRVRFRVYVNPVSVHSIRAALYRILGLSLPHTKLTLYHPLGHRLYPEDILDPRLPYFFQTAERPPHKRFRCSGCGRRGHRLDFCWSHNVARSDFTPDCKRL